MAGEADDRNSCSSCGALPPQTQSPYTLISATHGWRVTRVITPEGKSVGVFYCPTCWERMKRAKGARSA